MLRARPPRPQAKRRSLAGVDGIADSGRRHRRDDAATVGDEADRAEGQAAKTDGEEAPPSPKRQAGRGARSRRMRAVLVSRPGSKR